MREQESFERGSPKDTHMRLYRHFIGSDCLNACFQVRCERSIRVTVILWKHSTEQTVV